MYFKGIKMQNGDFVKISYIGRVKETNEIFDLTDEAVAKKEKIHDAKANYGPITLILGEKMILPAAEDEMRKMAAGETKTFELAPEKAFGPRDPRLIKVFNESEFRKNDMAPVPGLNVNVNGLRGKVLSSSAGRVRVDFNHPLSGKTLVYEMTFVGAVDKNEDKIKSIMQYYAGVKPESVGVSLDGAGVVVKLPARNAVHAEMKDKAATEIMKWVKADSVKFEEVFEKK